MQGYQVLIEVASLAFAVAVPVRAAQLEWPPKTDTRSNLTVTRLDVNGKFAADPLRQLHDPERFYVDLPGVTRASNGRTQSVMVPNDPRLRQIDAASHDVYSRVVFYVNTGVTAVIRRTSDSPSTLLIEFQGGGPWNAPPIAKPKPSPPPPATATGNPAPPLSTEKARVNSPLFPPIPAAPPAGSRRLEVPPARALPPPADEPRPLPPTAARVTSPAPTGVTRLVETVLAPPPGVLPRSSEDQVDVRDTALQFQPGTGHALLSALVRQKGYLAFTNPGGSQLAQYLLRVPDWDQVASANGVISLEPYFVLPLPQQEAPLADTLRSRYTISTTMPCYAVFPEDFTTKVLSAIRKDAAGRGVTGRVVSATLAFDQAGPDGMTVKEIQVAKGR